MPTFAEAGKAVEQNLRVLTRPGILAVRPGYHIEAGWPVGDPIIVALVASKKGEAASYGLPAQVDGIPVEVREATALERLRCTHPDTYAAVRDRTRVEWHPPEFPAEHIAGTPLAIAAAARGPAKQEIGYTPADRPLDPLTDTFTVICHASPDAGFPMLKEFLGRTQQKLSVGIYDFTSAHVLASVEAALTGAGGARALSLVLDHPTRNPTADQSDEETEQDLADKLGE